MPRGNITKWKQLTCLRMIRIKRSIVKYLYYLLKRNPLIKSLLNSFQVVAQTDFLWSRTIQRWHTYIWNIWSCFTFKNNHNANFPMTSVKSIGRLLTKEITEPQPPNKSTKLPYFSENIRGTKKWTFIKHFIPTDGEQSCLQHSV